MEEAVVWRCLFKLIVDKSRSFAHRFSPIPCFCCYTDFSAVNWFPVFEEHLVCSHKTFCGPRCDRANAECGDKKKTKN